MKRSRLSLVLSAFALVLAVGVCSVIVPAPAEAAGKAKVKVSAKYNTNYNNYTNQLVLTGKDQSGNVIWTYTSPSQPLTELNTNEYFKKGNNIYVFSDKLYCLNKKTGKVKWTYDISLGGVTASFDAAKNIYFTGYYYDSLICLGKKGNLIFKTAFPSDYWWPYEITIGNDTLSVKMEGYDYNYNPPSGYVLLTYTKDGRLIG